MSCELYGTSVTHPVAARQGGRRIHLPLSAKCTTLSLPQDAAWGLWGKWWSVVIRTPTSFLLYHFLHFTSRNESEGITHASLHETQLLETTIATEPRTRLYSPFSFGTVICAESIPDLPVWPRNGSGLSLMIAEKTDSNCRWHTHL